jgi:hypothetical protein
MLKGEKTVLRGAEKLGPDKAVGTSGAGEQSLDHFLRKVPEKAVLKVAVHHVADQGLALVLLARLSPAIVVTCAVASQGMKGAVCNKCDIHARCGSQPSLPHVP